MADSVIQATETVEFEDGLRTVVVLGGCSQYAERILNKTAKAINETFTGLKFMLQGFRIYFV